MPLFSRLISIVLRIGQVISAAVVAGIIGHYLHQYDEIHEVPPGRWIYTEVVAGLSILLGLIWMIPFSSNFFSWPIDVVLSFAWFASFGILVDALHNLHCENVGLLFGTVRASLAVCRRWRATEAFAFISACLWLVSAIVGIYFTLRVRQHTSDRYQRGWFRRSAV